MGIDERISELGLELPPAPSAVAVYRPSLIVGDLCYTCLLYTSDAADE